MISGGSTSGLFGKNFGVAALRIQSNALQKPTCSLTKRRIAYRNKRRRRKPQRFLPSMVGRAQMKLSNHLIIELLGWPAPTRASTASPFLNMTSVGMLRTL